jgi:hypothetical protein
MPSLPSTLSRSQCQLKPLALALSDVPSGPIPGGDQCPGVWMQVVGTSMDVRNLEDLEKVGHKGPTRELLFRLGRAI